MSAMAGVERERMTTGFEPPTQEDLAEAVFDEYERAQEALEQIQMACAVLAHLGRTEELKTASQAVEAAAVYAEGVPKI